MLQMLGIRPYELEDLQSCTAAKALETQKQTGSGVAAYLRSFGGTGKQAGVSIQEAAAHGLDWPYVNWIKALIVVRFDKYSTKVNGPTSSGQQSSMAAKMAPGDGFLNPAVLFGLSVRPPALLLTGDASELCDFVGNLAHVYCVLMPRQ
jgi:hypothetical protein